MIYATHTTGRTLCHDTSSHMPQTGTRNADNGAEYHLCAIGDVAAPRYEWIRADRLKKHEHKK